MKVSGVQPTEDLDSRRQGGWEVRSQMKYLSLVQQINALPSIENAVGLMERDSIPSVAMFMPDTASHNRILRSHGPKTRPNESEAGASCSPFGKNTHPKDI